ncbi:MAG TPA: peptidylprolyl isomerase [Gemmatimonadales bacterium]|nr:peptidylprolyl isomerase [Gemmatimonadales bacterium]
MRYLSLVCAIVTAATACKKAADKPASGAGAGPTAANAPIDFHDPTSPGFAAQAPDSFRARFTTTKGDFVIEVHRAWAPRGADRFYNLVRSGYYDGVRFFRVIPGFMAQFGIHGDTAVTAAWRERRIPDDPVRRTNVRGMVTFATAGPGTRTTQVFINYGNNDRLDGMGFAPFGQVTEGMNVVDALYGGYGDGAPAGHGPDQNRMHIEGEKYLARQFPKLDKVTKATVE